MFKKFLQKQRENRIEKLRLLRGAMESEIINAIQFEVREEQKTEKVSIPYFLEVQNRFKALRIATYKDLVRTYRQFAKQDRVSGAINEEYIASAVKKNLA